MKKIIAPLPTDLATREFWEITLANITESSLADLTTVRDQINTKIAELEETEIAKKKLAAQPIIKQLKNKFAQIKKEYEALDGTSHKVKFAIEFNLDLDITTVNTADWFDEFDGYTSSNCSIDDLFGVDVKATVLGKYSNEDATLINDAVENTFMEICSNGFHIVAPTIYKKLETVTTKLNSLFTELNQENLEIKDLDE